MAVMDFAVLKDYIETIESRVYETNPFISNPSNSIFSDLDAFMPASKTWVLTTSSDTSFSVSRGTDAISATVVPGYFSVIPDAWEDETKPGGYEYTFYGYEHVTNFNYPLSNLDISIPQYHYGNTYSVPIAFTESVWFETAVYQEFTLSRADMQPIDLLVGNGNLSINNGRVGISLQYLESGSLGLASQANIFSPLFRGDVEIFASLETLLDALGGDIIDNISGFSVDFEEGSFTFVDRGGDFEISDGSLTIVINKANYAGYTNVTPQQILSAFLEKESYLSLLDVARILQGNGVSVGHSYPVDISAGFEKIEWEGSVLFSNAASNSALTSGVVDQVLIFDGSYETLLQADSGKDFVTFGKKPGTVPEKQFHLDVGKLYKPSGFESKTNDLFLGGSAKDQMWLGEGNDFAMGHADDDVFIVWGKGSNQIFGGEDANNGDLISYNFNSDSVSLDLRKGHAERSGEKDIIQEIEHAIGTGKSDKIFGDQFDNIFLGASGADKLKGRGGDDKLFGNDGVDTLIGGGGHDYLFADEPYSADGAFATLGYGDLANDILRGGKGNDTLVAGAGKDRLLGGGGSDIFQFLPSFAEVGSHDNIAIVKDFEQGEDQLDLTHFVFYDDSGKDLLSFQQKIKKNFSFVDVDFYDVDALGGLASSQLRVKMLGFTEELVATDILS